MIGKTISHYKILEKLGGGGMGVVYKAEDTKLKRTVALKFLPQDLSRDDESKERFIHEAQAASALDHNNICTIYEIDETDDGQMFIAMACYDGETLKKKIEVGPQKLEEAIDISMQISEGLSKAHEKEIVHRDLKPANVMLTKDGVVKILDFGLAKLRGQTKLTKAGTTLGTAPYMSPEQARGEEVDNRTDIFSLGVLLYEMLTGQLPFKGDYHAAIIYSILNEEPEPITGLRTGVPMSLERIVNKCLEKESPSRYQHTDELAVDLQKVKKELETRDTLSKSADSIVVPKKRVNQLTIAVGAVFTLLLSFFGYFVFTGEEEGPKERVPIAVVDFVNQTSEPELDGLSGMLITALEQSRRLDVMSRARMYDEFKQMDRPELTFVDETAGREIAKRTNLSALAVATIRKFGQLYTVDFKVIDPQTGDRLFSTKVEGEDKKSIPGLLDKLSDKTRIDLKEQAESVQLSSQGVADVTTPNLEAYHHYFKGQEFVDKLDFEHAKEEFRQAIALDTTFALAYYRLAYAMSWNSEQLAREPLQKALRFIDRIPEKERFRIRAEELRQDQGFSAAVPVLKEMEKFYPQDKEMLFNIGDYSFHSGDFATAVAYFDKVLAIAPAHQRTQFHYGQAFMGMYTDPAFLKNDFRSALARAIRDREKQPDVPELTGAIATLYAYLGEYQKAEDEIIAYLSQATTPQAIQRGHTWLTSLLPYTGQYKRALSLLDTGIEEAFTRSDTATAVLNLVDKGLMSAVGLNSGENANAALDRALVFKDRTDVPNLKPALAILAAVSNRPALAFEVLEQAQDPAATAMVLIITGQCEQAAPMFEAMKGLPAVPGFIKLWMYYQFAECRFDEGDLINAEQNAEAALQIYHPLDDFARGVYYPKTLLLLGKISETKVDAPAAMQYYQRLLDLWKNADDDIPDLLEAKQRLSQLEETTAK